MENISADFLKGELENLKQQQKQLADNALALAGAMQMTEYLIHKLDPEPEPEVEVVDTTHTEVDVDPAG